MYEYSISKKEPKLFVASHENSKLGFAKRPQAYPVAQMLSIRLA